MTATLMNLVVLIGTRDRPEHLRRCLTSLAAVAPAIPVVVLDQSDADDSATVSASLGLTDLTWVRCDRKGRSRNVNAYLADCTADVIVQIDDDTTVGVDWLPAIARHFTEPGVDLLLGQLRPSRPSLPGEQLTTWVRSYAYRPSGRRARIRGHGLGASMVWRRNALERIGGFDPLLGPGTPFPGHDDFDSINRAIRAGLSVVYDPAYAVTHWGFRYDADGSRVRLFQGYARGRGAAAAKSLKSGDVIALLADVRAIWFRALTNRPILRRAKTGRPVPGWFGAYFSAFFQALRVPVDRKHGVFRDQDEW